MAKDLDIVSGQLPQYPYGPDNREYTGPPAVAKPPQVPDFVISGMMLPGGRVRVYASRDVQAAVSRPDYRAQEPRPDRPRRPDVTLTFRLREFVLVERDTLPQCLSEVERIWRTEP